MPAGRSTGLTIPAQLPSLLWALVAARRSPASLVDLCCPRRLTALRWLDSWSRSLLPSPASIVALRRLTDLRRPRRAWPSVALVGLLPSGRLIQASSDRCRRLLACRRFPVGQLPRVVSLLDSSCPHLL